MPTQYRQPQASPPRTRGFSPLFRGPYSDQQRADQQRADQLRVSDAERQAVTDRLAGHFADGRLDHAEFDERVGRAMSAKTRADLSGLFADLPDTGDLLNTGDLPGTGAPAVRERSGRRHRHPVLLIALLVVLAVAAGHAVLWVVAPLLWLAFVVLAVLVVTRALGHSRPGHER
jgi:uncharacterized protein DUF1707